MEDLDTLRLLSKLIPEYGMGVSEESIARNIYDIIFAIDETISIGHKESVTLSQVRTYTDMDSHEEKLQKIIQESKMNEAREQMRQKADDIQRKKMDEKRIAHELVITGKSTSRGGGFGSAAAGYSMLSDRDREDTFTSTLTTERTPSISSSKSTVTGQAKKSSTTSSGKPKGMQLGKSKKTEQDFFASIQKEDATVTNTSTTGAAGSTATGKANDDIAGDVLSHDSVSVIIEEKIDVTLDREGGVKKMEIKGAMKLQVFDPDHSKLIVHTNNALDEKTSGYKCRLHPKINKALFASQGYLALTDPTKPFPVGTDSGLDVLKWRKIESHETAVPITVNFWPNIENGETVVSCEYNAENQSAIELHDVQLIIPCHDQPNVTQSAGDWKYDNRNKQLIWHIGNITDDNRNGSIEFSVSEADGDSFFPLRIQFTSPTTFSGIQVTDVVHAENQSQELPFKPQITFSTDQYIVE